MNVIYEPKGRAKEYCDLALNLYEGCAHGCSYCFNPSILHKTREQFAQVKPRNGIIEALQKQLIKEGEKFKGREVFLCFTCDPYPMIENDYCITTEAIKLLHANSIIVRILTKAGKRSEKDFDLLSKKPLFSRYGTTLTFLPAGLGVGDYGEGRRYEPYTASPTDRISMLRIAHGRGIPTWVSLEPVIEPVQSLELISLTHWFVDEYKIGKINHNKELEQKIDRDYGWRRFTQEAIELLEKYGKRYYIKESLREYLKGKTNAKI